jgi:hypothetical protein
VIPGLLIVSFAIIGARQAALATVLFPGLHSSAVGRCTAFSDAPLVRAELTVFSTIVAAA